MRVAGILVGGLSVGGVETCIDLPELKVCFDIGRCPDAAVSRATVLFTHAHMDHMGGIGWHAATRALRGMAPASYVVPREDAERVAGLFQALRRLDRSDLPHVLVPLAPGEEHTLPNKLVVRPFRSVHVVPCQGYALWKRRAKLKPELAGLGEAEIRRRRLELGEAVADLVESPEIAFTGDSRIEVLEREEVVRTARVLVMECTFVDERVSVEETRAKGHVHLDEIAERAELFQNEAVVLSHFSARYTPQEIVAALDEKLPPGLRARVVPFLAATGLAPAR